MMYWLCRLSVLVATVLAVSSCNRVSGGSADPDGGGGGDEPPVCTDGYCDENATCSEDGSELVCACNDGWEGDGFTCEDVDECDLGLDDCDEEQGECINLPGSYECECADGFFLSCDGRTCLGDDAAIQISANAFSVCYVKRSGEAVCFGSTAGGYEDYGQLDPPAGEYKWIDVNARACGVLEDGTVQCWGKDPEPLVEPVPTSDDFEKVSVSSEGNACGLHTDGTIECWGCGACGTSPGYDLFDDIPEGSFEDVVVGSPSTCAMKADGTLACWTQVDTAQDYSPSGAFKQVGVNHDGQFWCGVGVEGEVECWSGDGSLGVTGFENGYTEFGFHDPSDMFLSLGCGHRMDLTVDCRLASVHGEWSYDEAGLEFCQIAVGAYFFCGILTDGQVECFGPGTEMIGYEP